MIDTIKKHIKRYVMIAKKLLNGQRPYIKIDSNAVFINSNSWVLFTDQRFQNSRELSLVWGSIDLVRPKDYSKIIGYIGAVDKRKLSRMKNLQWLQLPSHGFNGFDDKSLYSSDSVVVSNLRNVFAEPISDFCIAAFFYYYSFSLRSISESKLLLKDIPIAPQNVTVTIFGLGSIGKIVAKKSKMAGWTVLGVKKHLEQFIQPDYLDEVATFSQSDCFVSRSDYIINVLPETEETKGLFNYAFFCKMKRTALFCNVGRGSAVVDDDIERAVKEGIIAGAILDASTKKKYISNRIIVTNHTSSVSPCNAEEYDKFFSGQLSKFLSGEPVECSIPLK